MGTQKTKNPIEFVPRVMFTLFVIAVVACIVTMSFPRACHAERQVFLKDGVLTVWVDVMKVDGIPKEITDPQLAWAFVSGQTKKTIAGGKTITYMPKVGVQYGNEEEWSIVPITTTKH